MTRREAKRAPRRGTLDAFGTPAHLTRPDGSIAQQYKVDPWGRPRSGVTGAGNVLASANRKLFTVHEYAPNTVFMERADEAVVPHQRGA